MKRSHIWIIFVVTVAMVLITSTTASARGANPGVLPPDSRVQGLTYAEWSARLWQYIFSIPTPENPLTGGTGNQCVYQQIGNVGLVAFASTSEPILCEVPAGMMLYLHILSVECSNLEQDPFYGGNEEELRACVLNFSITDLKASIDGVAVENLDRYIQTSPLFEFTLPEDNILGSDELSGLSVANGAYLLLTPLSPGEHTVYLHAYLPEFEYTVEENIELTVRQ